MKNAIVQEAVEMRSDVNVKIGALLEQVQKLREQKKEISLDTVRILAEQRQISLAGLYLGWSFGQNNPLDNDEKQVLEQYETACKITSLCQRIFADFYQSTAYDKIADYIAQNPAGFRGARAGNHNNDYQRKAGFESSTYLAAENKRMLGWIANMVKPNSSE